MISCVREMAQQLRALVVLLKDQVRFPARISDGSQPHVIPAPRISFHIWPTDHLYKCRKLTQMHTYK